MLVGYARISKPDGNLDLQKDALIGAGVNPEMIYAEYACGQKEDRPELTNCLKTLRSGEDTLVVWKLDRLGRNLRHLIEIVQNLEKKNIGFRVLTGKGACVDTSTAPGRMIFAIFASLAEYERELIVERTKAGLLAARARGRVGGRKHLMTKAKLNIAHAALQNRKTKVRELCRELKISARTIYSYFSPKGELREPAYRLMRTLGI